MKNILFITMLLGVGYSQCNESNWQEYYPNMEGCYLPDADLSGEDLAGVDLSYAILVGANLSEANLIWANLRWANLAGANLGATWIDEDGLHGQANLTNANLQNANLQNANLTGSFLAFANLAFANLTGADLTSAMLYETCLEGAIGFTQTNYEYTPILEGCADTWGGEDCSYGDECFDAGAESGDLNLDGINDVLDVVMLVDNIINP